MLLNPYRFGVASIPSTLLAHCDGANGSTTFTDVYGHTITPNGNAQISTAQSKFGGASALFDGTGDSLSIANSTDFSYSGDFTLEFQIRFAAGSGTLMRLYNDESVTEYGILFNKNTANRFAFFYMPSDSPNKGDSGNLVSIEGTTAASLDTWYHIAVCRFASTIRLFVNGTQEASTSLTSGIYNPGSTKYFGQRFDGSGYLNGYMDEIRITKGTGRYTGNFTPPSAAFTE
jgi:hypothetical protein